jgi:excisionase family DNA binding protein
MNSDKNLSPPASEFLTLEELAERLKVSRTTVFSWLKNGELREGVHYLRLGRIVRFHWPIYPLQPIATTAESQPDASPFRKKQSRTGPGGTPVINLDY